MSDTQNDSGPPLLRPIPRRPFNFNIREPTPPKDHDNDDPSPPSPSRRDRPPVLNLESLNSRLLDARNGALTPSDSGPGSSSISRAQSILNLTGSTLMGIYTPGTYGPDRYSSPGTPWGTGAETPARSALSGFAVGPGPDPDDHDEEVLYDDGDDADEDEDEDDDAARQIEKRRRSSQYTAAVMGARRSSLLQRPDLDISDPHLRPQKPPPSSSFSPPLPAPAHAARLGARGLLLSALGVLYGVLVERILDRFGFAHGDHAHAHHQPPGTTTVAGYDWRYLAFWGVSGVVLGGLLPWFDGVWEGGLSSGSGVRRKNSSSSSRRTSVVGSTEMGGVGASACAAEDPEEEETAVPGPDWSLAVRGIGAFAGIAFAMRKLSWDSTLQVSAVLALVGPALWYLIDRSVPGLLMAGAVGVAGSALFMVPASVPLAGTLSPWAFLLAGGGSSSSSSSSSSSNGGGNVDGAWADGRGPAFNESSAAFASLLGDGAAEGSGGGGGGSSSVGIGRSSLESAVWMLSVLFCCCVCFGNIGRWLALQGGSGSGSSARKRDESVRLNADGVKR